MNAERLLKLADTIEKAEHFKSFKGNSALFDGGRELKGFDMTHYNNVSPCGTVGCIAGYAAMLWPSTTRMQHIPHVAAGALDLTFVDAEELFGPSDSIPLAEITPNQAAQALRLFADGERIDIAWYKAGVKQQY